MNKHRQAQQVKRAFRNDPVIAARAYQAQEKQIENLEMQLKAANSVILALSLGNYDLVDPITGEIRKIFEGGV